MQLIEPSLIREICWTRRSDFARS